MFGIIKMKTKVYDYTGQFSHYDSLVLIRGKYLNTNKDTQAVCKYGLYHKAVEYKDGYKMYKRYLKFKK